MSKVLAALLDKPEATVANVVGKLEQRAGNPSEDARLIAETSVQARAKISQLGLDPADTTGPELFRTLVARWESDCATVEKALGVNGEEDIKVRASKALELARHAASSVRLWALRTSVAKTSLRALSPKKTMKLLNYRSIESCLKREDPALLYMIASKLEPPTWQRKMDDRLRKLGSADFELREPELLLVDAKGLPKSDNLTLSSAALGVVGVRADQAGPEIPLLSMVVFVLDELEKLGADPSRFKLASINPTLRWWIGAEHLLAWNDGEPVSLNYKDIALSHLQQHDFAERARSYGSLALWGHLASRYAKHLQDLPEELASASKTAQAALVPPELAMEYSEA